MPADPAMKLTLRDMVRNWIDEKPGLTNEQIADGILRRLRVPVTSIEILIPAVAHVVHMMQREVGRNLEREAFYGKPATKGGRTVSQVKNRKAIGALQEFLAGSISIPGEGDQKWGKVTVDQIDSRREMIARQINGMCDHERVLVAARTLIIRHGVSCLDQIDGLTFDMLQSEIRKQRR
jgi:hypothetical protein